MLWLVVSTVLVVAVPFSVAIVFSFLSRYRTQLQLQSDGSPEQKRACRHGIVPYKRGRPAGRARPFSRSSPLTYGRAAGFAEATKDQALTRQGVQVSLHGTNLTCPPSCVRQCRQSA